MTEKRTSMDEANYLDILGQQPLLKIYTQICLCYAVADPSSHSAIVHTLKNGLMRLAIDFPWAAGQVVQEKSANGTAGLMKIIPLDPTPRLVVKDLREDPFMPSMDELREASFPFRMLDERKICPINTVPVGYGDPAVDVAPVFLLQVNFITNGLLLCFLGAHGAMDMTGQGQIIDLMSKACRGEPFTSQELSSGNLARRHLIPILDEGHSHGEELNHQITKPAPAQPASNSADAPPVQPQPPNCTWRYFSFSAAALRTLKSRAEDFELPPSCKYLSTDDSLTAFVWQAVARAREPRLKPTDSVKLARAVDVRPFLNIPHSYPGIIQNMTYHAYRCHELIDSPIGAVASDLRAALVPPTTNLAYITRALATFIERAPEAERDSVNFVASLDLSQDVMLSSWAKIDLYELDFGMGLGKPECVRRPQFIPFESLVYLMPKSRDGEIAVAICLRDEDLDRLKADDEVIKYAKYIP